MCSFDPNWAAVPVGQPDCSQSSSPIPYSYFQMLWEIDIFPAPSQPDFRAKQVAKDAAALGIAENITVKTAYGYLIQGDLTEEQVQTLADQLLADSVVETVEVRGLTPPALERSPALWVLPKPGVMDTAAATP